MFLNSVKVPSVLMAGFVWIAAAAAGSIPVANHSFEIPVIDPNVVNPPALPFAPFWIELDIDTDPCCGGRNTGVFLNTPPDSNDHIINAHGSQLAFLGGQTGNAFLQELPDIYQPGKSYRLKVDICPSTRYAPKITEPMDTLVLALYDPNSPDPNDLAYAVVFADEIIPNQLRTFTVYLPTVQPDDSWAGETIGIAIRAAGTPGTIDSGIGPYWDLDNVRLIEYPAVPEFTNDNLVNLEDFQELAAEWLQCGQTTADLTGEGCISLEDLLLFADFWLSHV